MKRRTRITNVLMSAVVAMGMVVASTIAHGQTTYSWTGNVDGDWTEADNWDVNGVPPPGAGNVGQLSGDRIVFNAVTSANPLPTSNIPSLVSRSGSYKTPSFEVLYGDTITFGGTTANWGYTQNSIVGDSNLVNGTVTLIYSTMYYFNRDPNSTKSWTVNADGILNFTRSATYDMSDGSARPSIFTINGGTISINGALKDFTTTSQAYVEFTASGANFTAKFGQNLPDLATVWANIGPTLSFRSTGGINLAAKDNGDTTFTVYADNTPPTLDTFTDDSTGTVVEFTPVTYSLSFSEEMDPASITVDDFINSAATSPSPINVETVTQVNATNFTVVVTPTNGGNLRLQVGTNVTDLAGNSLSAEVDDDNTIVVTDDVTAPTVSSIVDSAGGADTERFQQMTYTVTFDETLDAGTVAVSDFTNALDATITIDSVTPGANTNEFAVKVTPVTEGSLQLRVRSGSVADLAGNTLAANADDDDTITIIEDSTPPTLQSSDFVDNVSGGPVMPGTLVTYTVTFSEDMDDATVTAAVFGNAGSASVTISPVSETEAKSGVFTVPVTPTSEGMLQLQVNSGATLKDVAGNPLETNSAILDDTAITVDGTAPTLASADIVDDRSGGPIGKTIVVTYMLTFSEAINPSTVDSGAFSNVGTAPVTIGTIGQFAPNVFTVEVTPTAAGTLQLQVADSIADLAGNSLLAAATDGDEITIEDSVAYRWTGAVDGNWNNVTNWSPNGIPVDTVAGGNLDLRNSTDRIVFDGSAGLVAVPTSNVPTFSGGNAFDGANSNTPELDMLFGSLSIDVAVWGGQGLVQRPTWDSSVGDGDIENGTATLTYNMLGNQIHRDNGGIMTWTVNVDGTLNISNPSDTLDFSYGDGRFVAFDVAGMITFSKSIQMDGYSGNYFSLTAEGASVTAHFGGGFVNLAAVEAEIGDSLSFRSTLGRNPVAKDNGDETFTVAFPAASGTVILLR